jgi:hypothetical protein
MSVNEILGMKLMLSAKYPKAITCPPRYYANRLMTAEVMPRVEESFYIIHVICGQIMREGVWLRRTLENDRAFGARWSTERQHNSLSNVVVRYIIVVNS